MLIKFASKHKYFYETYLINFFPFNELFPFYSNKN